MSPLGRYVPRKRLHLTGVFPCRSLCRKHPPVAGVGGDVETICEDTLPIDVVPIRAAELPVTENFLYLNHAGVSPIPAPPRPGSAGRR